MIKDYGFCDLHLMVLLVAPFYFFTQPRKKNFNVCSFFFWLTWHSVVVFKFRQVQFAKHICGFYDEEIAIYMALTICHTFNPVHSK